jgi:hypothetical protein
MHIKRPGVQASHQQLADAPGTHTCCWALRPLRLTGSLPLRKAVMTSWRRPDTCNQTRAQVDGGVSLGSSRWRGRTRSWALLTVTCCSRSNYRHARHIRQRICLPGQRPRHGPRYSAASCCAAGCDQGLIAQLRQGRKRHDKTVHVRQQVREALHATLFMLMSAGFGDDLTCGHNWVNLDHRSHGFSLADAVTHALPHRSPAAASIST